jgi:hypothetical protein
MLLLQNLMLAVLAETLQLILWLQPKSMLLCAFRLHSMGSYLLACFNVNTYLWFSLQSISVVPFTCNDGRNANGAVELPTSFDRFSTSIDAYLTCMTPTHRIEVWLFNCDTAIFWWDRPWSLLLRTHFGWDCWLLLCPYWAVNIFWFTRVVLQGLDDPNAVNCMWFLKGPFFLYCFSLS